MKIILTQDVPNVGVLGDEVQVKAGYARNFLLPRGMAIQADTRQSNELQHRIHHLQRLREAAISKAKAEAETIKALSLKITKKSGLGGRLYGSVTNVEIQELLEAKGHSVFRKNIAPHEPIKSVGKHVVTVKLHTSVKVDVEIVVEAEMDEAALAAEAAAKEAAAAAGSAEMASVEESNASLEPEADEEAE